MIVVYFYYSEKIKKVNKKGRGIVAQVRTRKRGKTYSYIFEAGQVDGKRKVIEKGGFATKDEAYEAGVLAYTDWKHGNIGITSEKISLKEFTVQYMENVVRLNVRASSYRVYSNVIKHHIEPQIGQYALQDISPALLDGLIRQHARTGLSHAYLLQVRRILHQILDYAVYPAELIASNPANYIKIPKTAPKNIIKRHIISKEQYLTLLDKNPFGTRCHIPLVLLYHTGMRIGEVLGLCWEDIDLSEKPSISVKRQYSWLANVGNVMLPPKTSTSTRTIPIDKPLADLLRKWQVKCKENELALGDTYIIAVEQENHVIQAVSKGLINDNANRQYMVCVSRNGRPVSRPTLMRRLRMENLNAHSFRHTHATQLIEAGAPLKGVAGRLGHKRIDVTDEIYTHNTQKMQENVAAIFEEKMQTK